MLPKDSEEDKLGKRALVRKIRPAVHLSVAVTQGPVVCASGMACLEQINLINGYDLAV